ncbi:MAG: hypothetical protein M1813_009141 [Trichoglossum hirsutum]|nr:MAG: hypothetical protein M1813_009141 [Trichoglossum hirsutum]
MASQTLILTPAMLRPEGILLGFIAALALPHNWRLQSAAALLPAIPLLFLVPACPEPPRFLIRKTRYKDAHVSLRHLRDSEIQAARDLYAIHSQLQVETALLRGGPLGEWYNHEWYQEEVERTRFLQRVVPATHEPGLEELNYLFGVPTIEHVRFQLFSYLPWVYRRHILQTATRDEEPTFINFAQAHQAQQQQQAHSQPPVPLQQLGQANNSNQADPNPTY